MSIFLCISILVVVTVCAHPLNRTTLQNHSRVSKYISIYKTLNHKLMQGNVHVYIREEKVAN